MKAPTRVLLSRPDRIGDVVISTACLAPLREAWPESELFLLVDAPLLSLVEGHPLLAGVLSTQPEEHLVDRLKALELEAVFHLEPHAVIEKAAAKAKIPQRIGFDRKGRRHLTEAFEYPKKLGERHEAACLFDLFAPWELEAPKQLEASIHPRASEAQPAFARLPEDYGEKGFVVFHLGAHEGKPVIPVDYFQVAAKRVLNDTEHYLVLIGDASGREAREELRARLGAEATRLLDLCGRTTLSGSCALLSQCRAFLSRDTGPAHLAAAMGAPTLTVFLQPSPTMGSKRWKPLGPNVRVIEKELAQRWLEKDHAYATRHLMKIAPAEVAESLMQLVQGSA